MTGNYLKMPWRVLTRNKAYTALNIAGLALGISACILIYLYVQHELTYDRQHPHADRIYKIGSTLNMQGKSNRFGITPYGLAPALQEEMPELEAVCRVRITTRQTIWYGDHQMLNEEKLCYTDSTFFRIFKPEFLAGSPVTALKEPNSMVLTETLARKLFGSTEAAMGKMLRLTWYTFQVTGVVKDPTHSHLKFAALKSMSTFGPEKMKEKEEAWGNFLVYTYARLKSPAQEAAFIKAVKSIGEKSINPLLRKESLSFSMNFFPQPLTGIHLSNEVRDEPTPSGNRSYLYIFGVVAVFILLIACINYMNLATARSVKRAKEVGLRKVIGANRGQLMSQFVGESMLMAFVATVLALALVELLLPVFNQLTEKHFAANSLLQLGYVLPLFALVLTVGLLAGSYPAFFLSGFKPVSAFRAAKDPRSTGALLRKVLVVAQFSISLVLIIATLIVVRQMNFLKNTDLGFNKDQVLVLELPAGDSAAFRRLPGIKNELQQLPHVKDIAATAHLPGDEIGTSFFVVQDGDQRREVSLNAIWVDMGVLELMGVEMASGRPFSKDLATDMDNSIILNEAAVKWFGWKDAIGKQFNPGGGDPRTVIGVAKDFHYKSLHHQIEPLIIVPTNQWARHLAVRLSTENLAQTLPLIEQKWKAFDPAHPMEYYFLDEHFDQQYRAEEKMLTVFGYFAALTIFIGCLGLFGLASFTAEQRTKEIGIRKVLGSTVAGIVVLLTRDFLLLVLAAVAIASPVAWWGMQRWLEDFAYRTDITWWTFATAGFAALAVALLTVSYQAIKAAIRNPVDALRTE